MYEEQNKQSNSDFCKMAVVSILKCVPRPLQSHLIIIWTVGGLFHGRVLLFIPDLHTHHRVHVEADQLPGLDHCYAYLMGDVSPSEKTKQKTGCRGLQQKRKQHNP